MRLTKLQAQNRISFFSYTIIYFAGDPFNQWINEHLELKIIKISDSFDFN